MSALIECVDLFLVREDTKIWEVTLKNEDPLYTVGSWIVWAPWIHPMWQHYVVSVVHLRPMPGPPVEFQFKGATHEFMVLCVSPDVVFIPEELVGGSMIDCMLPPSIVQQFVTSTDAEALELCGRAMKLFFYEGVSIDSDNQETWKQYFLGGNSGREKRQPG